MRPTVFFSSAGQVWPTSQCCGTSPQDLFASGNSGCKHLILQVPVQQSQAFDHFHHPSRFRSISREWLLTSNANQLPSAGTKCVTDRLHIWQALMVWTTQP